MKVCSQCKKEKENTKFYKNKTGKLGLAWNCKDCALSYQKKRRSSLEYKENSKKYNEEYRNKRNEAGDRIIHWVRQTYSGIPCMDCNVVHPWCVMDFDHRPEEVKEFDISYMNNYTITPERIAQVEKEIAKCDLVCSNCHRIRTWIERPTKDTP